LHGAPEIYYFLGLEFVTFAVMIFFLSGLKASVPVVAVTCLLILPASQAALALVNQLITRILPAVPLPKLDFSKGLPVDCSTIITVPALLIHEQQVRQLVHDLEVRFLSNRIRNLYFALLTDLPDSPERTEENTELVELCSSLVKALNAKYGPQQAA